ncbi:RecX family transcriptional regulator [Facklamia sp. 7083-14-GEN3]|uniref:RecX family transcriptional regulator n=1 Tax=Facklamia sp. 7083-14-GEN3 TaxID=2973478 RepID=UPI00215BE0DA|nr:RecX family transcriptional regulator [Facklamia sp. 7083-14-GEN3]MCR8968549.1 RecX family transcriptional regulator [Facklamia sp. 7083-14-GEN3]
MKISKIQVQKKNKQRYSIFINNQFAFGIDEAILIKFAIRKGLEVDQKLIEKVLEAEFHYQFYQKTLNYLSYGLKSEQEVRDYLAKMVKESQSEKLEERHNLLKESESSSQKSSLSNFSKKNSRFDYASFEVSESLIEQIIDKLKTQNLINDLIYGQAYVRTQANINRKGPRNISYELKMKGLNDLIIEDALMEYPEDLKRENLEILADKYIKSKKRLSLAMLKTKLYQHLNQKGYDRIIIQTFLDNYKIEVDPELQENLLDQEGQKLFRKRSKKYGGYELKKRLIVDLRQKGFNYQDIQNWLEDNENMIKMKGESE